MIDLFYQWYIVLKSKNIPGRKLFYKLIKLIVNVVYPILIPFHHELGVDPNSNVIISLTSFPARIRTTYITIDTLLEQTQKPQKVILYLAESQFKNREKDLPRKLLDLKKRGLEINFCDDLRSHKKYYYALLDYPDEFILTVDDDMFYPKNLVKQLYQKNREYPNTVVCNWGHEITFYEDGKIKPYLNWKGGVSGHTTPSILLSPVGAEGILYPPHSVHVSVFEKEAIKNCAPYADDLWLKMMCVRNGTMAVRATEVAIPYFNIVSSQKFTLQKTNISENQNDIQLKAILNQYPDILKKMNDE